MADLASELAKYPGRLPPAKLRRICDPKSLAFNTTAELKPFDGLIGQDLLQDLVFVYDGPRGAFRLERG